LEALVRKDEALPANEQRLLSGNAAAHQKAESMITTIKDAHFSHTIARYVNMNI
jgi:hypothetical protein